MHVKRFVASDMRRALELVRQEMGSDAVILSNRRVKEGVEILTTLPGGGEAAGSVQPQPPEAPPQPSQPAALFGEQAPHKAGKSGRDIADEIERASRRLAATRDLDASADEFLRDRQVVNAGIERRDPAANESPEAPAPQSAAERYGLLDEPAPQPVRPVESPTDRRDPEISELQEELAEMRAMLEEQLGRLADKPSGGPGAGAAGGIGRRLVRMGFDESLVERALQRPLNNRQLSRAWPEALARVAHQVPVTDSDIVAGGGVFALVGPTGVGKTTTVAKLAARYVMEHGADKVALVTTDTHRLAAHDQLRSLARILQVPVRSVDEHNPLASVLRSLRRCELVLIDTPGLRHGDPELKRQMQELSTIARVRSLLVMSANSQSQMLKAALHAYSGASLEACVLTKLDETASLGEAVGSAMQAGLPIAYTTDGQDIPADLEMARGHKLVTRAAQLVSAGRHKARANSL